MNEVPKSTKTKTTAVVLAVLFGAFSWLYTYKKNYSKFWIVIGVSIFLWASYLGSSELVIGSLVLMLLWVWNIAIYVWAIVDNATKPDSYFINYPDKITKTCPFCKKEIDKEASVCPYCRKDQTVMDSK